MTAGYGVATVQRPRITKMAEMRVSTAKSMRKLAESLQDRHPEMMTHKHVRDAARALDMGMTQAAGRHLDAAMHTLAPQSLIRHGIRDDDGHVNAKQDMTEVWRHALLVKDLTDLHEETQSRLADIRAMKGPMGTPVGVDRAMAAGPTSSGEKQLPPRADASQAASRNLGGSLVGMSTTHGSGVRAANQQVIDLVGPKGYVHGWKFVGVPKFQYEGGQGGQGHVRAIYDLGEKYKPTGPLAVSYATGPAQDMYSTAMQNTAKAVERRDYKSMQAHLDSALFAARHMGPSAVADVHAVRHSLEGLSPIVSGRHDPRVGETKAGKRLIGAGISQPGEQAYKGYAEHNLPSPRTIGYSNVDLSARTAMLERTPAPRGAPGGPGLYHVKGLGHTPYFQQVVKALIEKRGMAPDKAYKIAWGALRKWRRGGGHVHPEVQVAASGALAGEASRGAMAKSMAQVCDAIEMATVIELFNPYHAPTGQFTTAQGAGQAQGKKKLTPQQRQHLKEQLLGRAAADRAKAHALMQQLKTLRASIAAGAHSGKTKAGTKAGSKASNPAPAKKGTPPAKGGSAAAKRASSAATAQGRIVALVAQIASLLAQARAATAAAHKL